MLKKDLIYNSLIKHLTINVTEVMWDIYKENYQILLREIKKDLKIRQFNILSQMIYRLTIPNEKPTRIFHGTWQTNFKVYIEMQKAKKSQDT